MTVRTDLYALINSNFADNNSRAITEAKAREVVRGMLDQQLMYQGAYDAGITYFKSDLVVYATGIWIWINDTPGQGRTPAIGAYWEPWLDLGPINQEAEGWAALAQAWATQPVDEQVAGQANPAARSALHYAAKAAEQLGLVSDAVTAALLTIGNAVTAGLLSISTAVTSGVVSINNTVSSGMATLTAYVSAALVQMAGYVATAAAIAGITTTFATKALATAGLAGVAANAYVLVLTDESKNSFRTIYQKVSGAYVFVGYMPGVRDVYVSNVVDPLGNQLGNDANDGLTPVTPVRTLAAARAIASGYCNIWLMRGSIWKAEYVDWSPLFGVHFRAYGQGPRPVLSCRQSLSAQTWTQPDIINYPNVWMTTVVIPFNPANPVSFPILSSSSAIWQPALYDEARLLRIPDQGMTRRFTGVDRPACLALVQANPNSFYCNITGDVTHVTPLANGVQGNSVDYYVNLIDGSNPNGRNISHVDQRAVAEFPRDCNVTGLLLECTGSKDFIATDYGGVNTTMAHWQDTTIQECAIHGSVHTGASYENCEMLAAYHGGPVAFNGGAFHSFRGTSTQGRSRGVRHRNIRAKGFFIAVYSHGAGALTGGTGYEHQFVEVNGLEADGCSYICDLGNVVQGVTMRNVRAYELAGAVANVTSGTDTTVRGNVTFIDSKIVFVEGLSGTAYCLFGDYGANGTKLKLINSFVHNPGTAALLIIAGFNTSANTAGNPILELDNSIVTGPWTNGGTAARDRLNFRLSNKSYFGTIVDPNGVPPFTGDCVQDASSMIAYRSASPADVQAVYPTGIDALCETGVFKQVFSRVLVDTDFNYVTTVSNRSYSYTGTPDSGAPGAVGSVATLTANAAVSVNIGRQIKITDAYGAGLHYFGRVINRNSNGAFTAITVTPSPTGAFANKNFQVGFTNFRPFGPDMTLSARIEADGTKIGWSTGDAGVGKGKFFCVGMLLRILNVPGFPGVSYLRKITAISGDIMTLNEAIPWNVFQFGAAYNTLDLTTSIRMPLPLINIAFGFQIPPYNSGTTGRAKVNVTFVDGGSSGDVYVLVAAQKFSGYANATYELIANYDYTATFQINGYSGPYGLDVQTGIIAQGFSAGSGDTITFTMNVDVAEWRLANNLAANIASSGNLFLKADSEMRRRGWLGYRAKDKGF